LITLSNLAKHRVSKYDEQNRDQFNKEFLLKFCRKVQKADSIMKRKY